ncbi:hypothetical protein V3481_013164 [Fusarium oxysporum f. sp. vasinfectum]|uniref:DUF676 domain-containing protein n=1 Tax=Fusarium oxysporum f. sp. vasinfectum 25433 TaxID=1089449 RepID=X0M025_FUSOX|nr:hypothetical protein FOTG_07013 [Fusarium oxysporum f. sp. vasinfectum 25433]
MYSSPDSDSELPYMEPPSNEALEPIRKPPPYTGTPLFLFLSDIKLFFQDFFYLPYLFIPLYPWKYGPFCELCPSRENLIGITIHCILSATQFAFLVSLAGVFFDLIQCLIQRALLYATQDVRECYILVKNALLDDHKKKVILILHSQCGIEGGMIIDWLLDEMPLDKLQKLKVYTFSNLANHFSNPYRGNGTRSSVIPHIEHHVNEKDFACRFGVLNFTRHYTQNENRFAGKVFINRGGASAESALS